MVADWPFWKRWKVWYAGGLLYDEDTGRVYLFLSESEARFIRRISQETGIPQQTLHYFHIVAAMARDFVRSKVHTHTVQEGLGYLQCMAFGLLRVFTKPPTKEDIEMGMVMLNTWARELNDTHRRHYMQVTSLVWNTVRDWLLAHPDGPHKFDIPDGPDDFDSADEVGD